MVNVLEDDDGIDGDNDVDSPTGDDGTVNGCGSGGSDDVDEIETTDACSI